MIKINSTLFYPRSYQNDWPKAAAYCVNKFMRSPSERNYSACMDSAIRADAWPQTRKYLKAYLESGTLPWDNSGWPSLDPELCFLIVWF